MQAKYPQRAELLVFKPFMEARLPTMHGQSDNVEAGGLMSYGAASAGRASGGEKLAEWEIRAPQERGPSVKHFGGEVVIRPETILA
jgi:hypothetical protein